VIPINGDLVIEGLGIDKGIRAMLTEEVQIILNTAASINFNDPLRTALNINFFGAIRVQDLAHDCKNLIAMHHVSTAYCNSFLPTESVIAEEILPWV
jgi:fatty acyl-CoA reductase